jgi:hypothetical protein
LFAPLITGPSGSTPNAIAAGDFNGDSHADLVITNGDAGFTALPGLSGGAFDTPRINTGFGGHAQDVVISDLDGDTHDDLAVVDSSNDRVVVYRGPTGGTFSNPSFFTVGQNPGAIVVADVNGDTKPDLIVANRGSLSLGVLLAGGASIFSPQVITPTQAPVQSIAADDFNGDGRADVAVTTANGELAVFFGNADGTLTFSAAYLTDQNPTDVVVGNFNSDGRPDLAITIQAQGRLQILVNGTNGIFNNGQSVFLGGTPEDVVVGDLNDDGLEDLAVVNPSVSQVQVLLGIGGGGVAGPFSYPTAAQAVRIVVADFDGDTLQDLAVLTPSTSSIIVLRQNDLLPIGLAPLPIDQTSTVLNNALIAAFADAETGTTAAEYQAKITWGDGTADTPGIVTFGTSGFFEISGSHTFADPGTFQAKVLLVHQGGRFVQTQTQIHIGLPALNAAGIPVTALVNQPFNGPVAAVADQNPTSVASDFTAVIDWGDGTAATNGTVVAFSAGFRVDGSHTYTTSNSFQIQVSINHRDGRTAQATSVAVVSANALIAVGTALQALVGQPLVNVNLGSLVDPTNATTAADFTVSVDWGDGSAATTGTVVPSTPGFNILGSHTYTAHNNYIVTLSILAADSRTALALGSVDVQSGGLTATAAPFIAFANKPIPTSPVAVISDAQTSSVASDFTVTISWGDGAQSAGFVNSLSPGQFRVFGAHTYAAAGVFQFTVDVHHTDGRSVSATTTAVIDVARLVAIPLQGLSATVGVPLSDATIAVITDPIPTTTASQFTATIDWGDGTSATAGTVVVRPAGGFFLRGSHTYTVFGDHQLHINVLHSDGRTTTADGSVSVAAFAISAEGINVPAIAGLRTAPIRVATFTDDAPSTTVADYRADIDWGDGHTSSGVITQRPDGVFVVRGRNTYRHAGAFSVEVVIHHTDGRSAPTKSRARAINAARVGLTQTLHLTAGKPLNGKVFSFIDPNPLSVASDYQATVDFGDASLSVTGVVRKTGLRFDIFANHVYAHGNYTLQVHITDVFGGQYDAKVDVTVL